MRLMETGYATYGECFTVPVAHKRVTFLIGPDVSPHFFKATDDEMSQTEVSNPLLEFCTGCLPLILIRTPTPLHAGI